MRSLPTRMPPRLLERRRTLERQNLEEDAPAAWQRSARTRVMHAYSIPPVSRRMLMFIVVTLALFFGQPRIAYAHATLIQTDPATGASLAQSPKAITLWFSEPIEPEYSRVEIVRADGSRVRASTPVQPNGVTQPGLRVELDDDLERGSYTVVWSTLSAVDGHVAEGFFSFAVGDALLPSAAQETALAREAAGTEAAPQVVDVVVRWVNLLSQAVVAGILVFLALVLMPVMRRAGHGVPARPFRRVLLLALVGLALGQIAAAIVQAMDATRMTARDVLGAPLLTVVTETRYGALWLARSVLLVALALVVWTIVRRERLLSISCNDRLYWGVAFVVAALVLLTTSLGSHAAARTASLSWPVGNDWLHLAATSIWAGGLVALLPGVRIARSVGVLQPVLARFSALAIGAVIILSVTGLLSTRLEVASWDGLVSTDYGSWLILKLALVVATLGLGAWHLLNAPPVLDSSSDAAVHMERRFLRSLRVEIALVIGVIAVTGLLTSSIPARDLLDSDRQFATTRILSDAPVTLRVTPGQVGTNEFSVVIGPVDEATFGTIQRVYLRFTPTGDADVSASQRVQLQQAGPADPYMFRGAGTWLSFDGDWEVAVVIRRAGVAEDLETTFDLTASGDDLRLTGVAVASSDSPVPAAFGLGAIWIVTGLGLVFGGLMFRRRQRLALSYGLLALSLVAFVMGSILVLASGVVVS